MNDIKSIRFPPPVADEMVRAILEDHKTVTRRVVMPQPLRVLNSPYHKQHPETPDKVLLERLCMPPYRPGDILYVRETWRIWRAHRYEADAYIKFKAGGEGTVLHFPYGGTDSINRKDYDDFIGKWGIGGRWRPSIHMPREAARIFLRVTDVRVQQLKDITDADALQEGFYSRASLVSELLKIYPDLTADSWLWVIEFEQISREEAVSRVVL